MSKPELHELVAYFENRNRDTGVFPEMKLHMLHAFGQVFDHAGNFHARFDPYYTDRTLEDIGTGEDQRGTEKQIRVAHFLFDESGALREWLHGPFNDLRHTYTPSLTSDVAKLYFGVEMTRITGGQYPAVYAWK